MFVPIRRYRVLYQPAAVGSAETKAIMTVKAGWRVIHVSVRPVTPAAAGTNTTIEIGDGTDTDGYVAAIDTETMVGTTLIDGQGALFAQGAKLYVADDTIDAKYVNGGTPGAVNPAILVTICYQKIW